MQNIYFIEGSTESKNKEYVEVLKRKLMDKTNKITILNDRDMEVLSIIDRAIVNKSRFDFILLKIREMWRKSNLPEDFNKICDEVLKHTALIGNNYIVNFKKINFPSKDFDEASRIFEKHLIVDEYVNFEKIIKTALLILDHFIKKEIKGGLYIVRNNFFSNLVSELTRVYSLKDEVVIESINKQLKEYNLLPSIKYVSDNSCGDEILKIVTKLKLDIEVV